MDRETARRVVLLTMALAGFERALAELQRAVRWLRQAMDN